MISVDETTVRKTGRIVDPEGAVMVVWKAVFHVVGDVDVATGDNTITDSQRRLLGE